MNRFFAFFASILFLAFPTLAQTADWRVSVPSGTNAPSNLELVNQCRNPHSFRAEFQNTPFLTPQGPTEVQLNGGERRTVPVLFRAVGLMPGNYNGQVIVKCLDCNREPTCTQDTETLRVFLTVIESPPNPNPNPNPQNTPPTNTRPDTDPKRDGVRISTDMPLKDPCADKRADCDKLLEALRSAEAEAAALTKAANEARSTADVLAGKAREAEKAAKPGNEGGTITVDGEKFTQADSDFLDAKRKRLMDDWKAGKISAEEQQRQRAELSGPDALKKAREERLQQEAELKRKAEAARRQADEAKAAAEKARKEADAAGEKVAAARAEYERCLKELKAECERQAEIKRQKDEAEKKAEALRNAKLKEEAEAAERKRAEDEAARKLVAEREYLLDNIRRLGLISSREFEEIPGALDYVFDRLIPDILSKNTKDLIKEIGTMVAEEGAKTPVPTDVLKALGGLYNIAGALLDPCTQAGMRKTVERLQTMTNPKTGSKYTLNEALDKTERMCKLLKELKSKLAELRKAQK